MRDEAPIHVGQIIKSTATFLLMATVSYTLSAAEPALTGDRVPTKDGALIIHPINHATLALGWKDLVVYVDPVGDASRFAGLPRPNLVLITHIHPDHLSVDTLKAVTDSNTRLVVTPTVAEQLPQSLRQQSTILTNGQTTSLLGLAIQAVPAYNLHPERQKFHPKGRDNGYVVTFGDKRVYLSGDTEDTPEMRSLKNIDVAFVCMNLPYTMDVNQAASAVREFRPKIVYPYHSRGSDLQNFKSLVSADPNIEVRLRNWY